MEKNERFSNKIVSVSFILACMIVYLHANNTRNYAYEYTIFGNIVIFIQRVMDYLQRVCVPMFFTISGYLFFRNFSINKIMEKYKRRVKSLVIPYIIWNTISYLFFVALTMIPFVKGKINIEDVKFGLMSLIDAIINSRYSTLWFIQFLIIFIVIAPIIFYMLRNKKVGCFVMMGIFSLNIMTLTIRYNEVYSTTELNVFNLIYDVSFFMLGAFLAMHFKKYVEVKNNKMIRISNYMIFIMIILAVFITILNEKIIYIQTLSYIFNIVFIAVLWEFADNFSFSNIRWWEKISFFIYCTHMIILLIIQKIVLIISKGNIYVGAVDYIISPIICILIIIILAKGLRKHLPKTWKVITGGRG